MKVKLRERHTTLIYDVEGAEVRWETWGEYPHHWCDSCEDYGVCGHIEAVRKHRKRLEQLRDELEIE